MPCPHTSSPASHSLSTQDPVLPQVICTSGALGNCPGPCLQCNRRNDMCEPADFTGTCTTAEGSTGHCTGGQCKVR